MAWDPTAPGATSQQDGSGPKTYPKPNVVSGNQAKMRTEFYTTNPSGWDVAKGTGMAIAAVAGLIPTVTVTMGTTVNDVTTFTGQQSFSPPFNAAFGFKISQKIANNEIYFELVAENPDGSLDETTIASWRIAGSDNVTTTNGVAQLRNGPQSTGKFQSAALAVSAVTADGVLEITVESDETWFHSKALNSSASRVTSQNYNQISLDPNRRYRPRIRLLNGGTAPASSTTVTLYYVNVVDYTEIQAAISTGSGTIVAGQGIPVYQVNPATSPTLLPAATAASYSTSKVLSAASLNPTLLKSTAGRIYGYRFYNSSAAVRYVKFYNKATAPVVGTDVPFLTIAIPAGQTVSDQVTFPFICTLGIGYGITAAVADTDNTVVAANDVQGFINWM